jgi:hypothetical protein
MEPDYSLEAAVAEVLRQRVEIERLRAGLDEVRIKLRDARDNLRSDHMFGLAGLCEALMVGVEAVIANQQIEDAKS